MTMNLVSAFDWLIVVSFLKRRTILVTEIGMLLAIFVRPCGLVIRKVPLPILGPFLSTKFLSKIFFLLENLIAN